MTDAESALAAPDPASTTPSAPGPSAHAALPPLPPLMAHHAGALPPDPADAPPLSWGILGAGGIAHKFAREATFANGRVVAVGSRTDGKAQRFAAETGIECAGTYEDVLARTDVDAVYVATTHDRHLEAARLALEAGKPVLVEKPLTRNAAEAQRLREAAEQRGLLVMEAMWSRFLPSWMVIRGLVRSGLLGEIRAVRAEHDQYLRGIDRIEKPELAGGAALDLGVYAASFVHWVLGAPGAVSAAGRLSEKGVDVGFAATLAYPAATAVLQSSMDALGPTSALIAGEHGFLSLPEQFYRPSTIRLVLTRGPEVEARGGERIEETWSITSLADRGFEYEAAAFSRALHGGQTEVPGHGWDDALQVLGTLDQIRADVGAVLPGE